MKYLYMASQISLPHLHIHYIALFYFFHASMFCIHCIYNSYIYQQIDPELVTSVYLAMSTNYTVIESVQTEWIPEEHMFYL